MKSYFILLLIGLLLAKVYCQSKSDYDTLREIVEILQVRITALEVENSEFKAGVTALADQNGKFEERITKLESENEEFNVKFRRQAKKLNKLKEILENCEEKRKTVVKENYCEINATGLNEGIFIDGYEPAELETKKFLVSESLRVNCSESRSAYVASNESEETVITCVKHKIWTTNPSDFECRKMPEIMPEKKDSSKQTHQLIDLMFVLDGSESVGDDNFKNMKNWVKSVSKKFEISTYTMVGVMQYSHFFISRDEDDQRFMKIEIPLNHYSRSDFEARIDDITLHGYTTYTAHAIETVTRHFKASERFNDSRTTKIMVLLTDGIATDKSRLEEAARYARSHGIIIYAVGVGNYSEKELQIITNDSKRIYTLANFTQFTYIVDSLVEKILNNAQENYCEINVTSLNDGIFIDGYEPAELEIKRFSVFESLHVFCSGSGNAYVASNESEKAVITCVKHKVWTTNPSDFECRNIPAIVPEEEDSNKQTHQLVDLMFVLDGSGSVGDDNFKNVKNWMKSVSKKFEISAYTMIGVMQYSHFSIGRDEDDQPYMKIEIPLNHYSRSDFEARIDNITLHGYTTYTARAIEMVTRHFKASERFNDSRTTKIMVLLTDGRANDNSRLEEAARYARSHGIIIYAVGVGAYSEKELKIITNDSKRIFALSNFKGLTYIVDSLIGSIRNDAQG